MLLPLLLGSRPQFSGNGPTILLHEGDWEVFTDKVINSIVKLECDETDGKDLRSVIELNGVPIKLEGPRKVRVAYVKRGSEDFISVYARLVSV